MPNISELKDEEDDPVNGCNDGVEGESRMMVLVLTPDCSSSIDVIVWSMEGIVDTADDDEQPCYDSRDLVDQETSCTMSLSFGEWIDAMEPLHCKEPFCGLASVLEGLDVSQCRSN